MKTILSKLSNKKAQQELPKFLKAGYIMAGIALLIFGWLALGGVIAGVRATLLTYHKGNASNPKLMQYRAASYALIALSLAEYIAVQIAY